MTIKTCAMALALTLAVTLGAFAADERVGDPYSLNVCPVTGSEFGAMGDPVAIIHEGREIKFCCAGCKPKFEADPAKYIAKVDEMMIAQQKANYPLDTCLVSGQKLDSKGGQIDMIVNNRHVALCCAGCKAKINADPAGFIAKLDEAVIAKQAATYPFKKCPVSGDAIGDKPVNVVIGNQLIELCCNGCKDKVNADPAKYIAMVKSGKMGEIEGSSHK